MNEERKLFRTDIERIEDALNVLCDVATLPGPDTQTQILNGIREMKKALKQPDDEA